MKWRIAIAGSVRLLHVLQKKEMSVLEGQVHTRGHPYHIGQEIGTWKRSSPRGDSRYPLVPAERLSHNAPAAQGERKKISRPGASFLEAQVKRLKLKERPVAGPRRHR